VHVAVVKSTISGYDLLRQNSPTVLMSSIRKDAWYIGLEIVETQLVLVAKLTI
jgi:hypothetical protein